MHYEARRIRGVAQSGRAFGWGPKGRRFKSCRPDWFGGPWNKGTKESDRYPLRVSGATWEQVLPGTEIGDSPKSPRFQLSGGFRHGSKSSRHAAENYCSSS